MDNNTILELKNVTYEASGKEILKNINLRVRKRAIHSIIGVNGTGKTTLAAIIMGLEGYMPKKGKIIFNGKKDITKLPLTKRAKLGITLTWQIPANFEGMTVKEYLTFKGSNPHEYLKLVGLNPKSYIDRIVDENLSGGERKRIELASALSMNPKLVILDEPDSGIDMASINIIKNVIRTFKGKGTSIILITHNEEIAKIGDSVSLLCDGEIVKEGDMEKVTSFFKKYCNSCDHIGIKNRRF